MSDSLTTGATGAPIAQTRYRPYGKERWSNGDTPTDFTFTGQRADGFGLLDYNARYYDSGLGRFISPDTVIPDPTNPQNFNRYSYVLGNPTRYTDPTGHCTPEDGQISCTEIVQSQGSAVRGTTTVVSNPRPTIQPVTDLYNRGSSLGALPLAVAGQTTNIVGGGLMYKPMGVTARSITPIQLMPNNALIEVPSSAARLSTVASYGLPAVGWALNQQGINYRAQAGEINPNQAYQQGVANAGFSALTALGSGALIPAAAATTSNPIGWSIAGSVALSYDVSVAQGTFNNYIEGQSLNQAFTNARAETNRSFGIGGFDAAASKVLHPILTPVVKTVYGIP